MLKKLWDFKERPVQFDMDIRLSCQGLKLKLTYFLPDITMFS